METDGCEIGGIRTKFADVTKHYERLEATTKRLEMGDILVDLIKSCPIDTVDKVLLLTQGKLFPDYAEVELGIADKLLMKTLSTMKAIPEKDLEAQLVELGDLGMVAEFYFSQKSQKTLMDWGGQEVEEPLSVEEVHSELLKLSGKKAKDSQSMKMDILKRLLQRATPSEAKYLVRIVTKKMRLGVKDLSILEALAYIYSPEFSDIVERTDGNLDSILAGLDEAPEVLTRARSLLSDRKPSSIQALEEAIKETKKALKAKTSPNKDQLLSVLADLDAEVPNARSAVKQTRETIETAYNLSSDIGVLAVKLKTSGMDGIKDITISPGIPIRSMLAERLPSLEEILEKMGGSCGLEYKYDGLRLQVHISSDSIELFSRGLENMTPQFPDVVEAVKTAFKGRSGIFDGECIPLDPNTGDVLPFQFISRRARRKYDLSTSVKSETLDDFKVAGFEEKIPVSLVLFDCLFLDGNDLTMKDYPTRRRLLSQAFDFDDSVALSTQIEVDNMDAANDFFTASIESGCEGILAKSIGPDSVYKAGKRGFIWIKYKRDYKMELGDSMDLVVVGAFHGRGRRTGVYGAFLMATFNPETNNFETICKLGTGFDDEALKDLHGRLNAKVLSEAPEWLEKNPNLIPDVYFESELLLEVKGAEITFSPVHTCARSVLKKDFGLSLRFPRYTGRLRDDKTPEEATTTQEAISMYKNQSKRSQ
jgi:DNA ligase-1